MDENRKKEVIRNARKDEFAFSSTDISEVMWFLGEISNATRVHEVKHPVVSVAKKGDVRLFQAEYDALNVTQTTISDPDYTPESLEGDYEDCANRTGLLYSFDDSDKHYLTRNTAFSGICDRTRTRGEGWAELYYIDREKFCQSLNNLYLTLRDKAVTVVEVMGRVTSVASGAYTHLDQKKLLQAFLVAVADKGGELSNFSYSHDLTYALADFPPELVASYAVDKLGFDPKKAKLQMFMKNSVTRSSSARVYFLIKEEDREFVALGNCTTHRGKSALEAFTTSCLSMHQALEQTIDTVVELQKIVLKNGESTVHEVAKRAGIGKAKIEAEIKDAKLKGVDFTKMTAFDGYIFLNNVISSAPISKARVKGFTGNTDLISSYVKAEIKAQIVIANWSDIDRVLYHDEVDATPQAEAVDPRQISLLSEEEEVGTC